MSDAHSGRRRTPPTYGVDGVISSEAIAGQYLEGWQALLSQTTGGSHAGEEAVHAKDP